MVEIKDELLNGTPVFRIRDNITGNILLDNITIEMITEILQEATAVNKALLEELRLSFPNARYWLPSLVFGSEAVYKGNVMPTLQSNTSDPNFTVSGYFSNAYLLFDENYQDRFSESDKIRMGSTTQNVIVQFSTPVRVVRYRYYARTSSSYYSTIRLLGSNDGNSWTSLSLGKSLSNSDNYREYSCDVNASQYYKYLRFDKESNSDGDPWVKKINLDVYQVETSGNANYLDLDFGKSIKEYILGQRVSIRVPSNFDTGLPCKLQIDGLGYVDAPSLSPNADVRLKYNGSAFVIE